MQIQKARISDLISPEWNPRQITEDELKKLETSLNEFGYIEPIIVNDVNNHIVGGNQRYKALQSIGYTEVDVVYVHIEDLNKEKACNVALNKISGDWDNDKLGKIFEKLKVDHFDLKLTGFEDIEIDILTDDIDFDDFFDYDEEKEEEMPDDFVEVTGESKTNYEIIISIDNKETADKIMENLGTEKRMTNTSCVLTLDDLNGFI